MHYFNNDYLDNLQWKEATYYGDPIGDFIVSEDGLLYNPVTCKFKRAHNNSKTDLHQRVRINGVNYYLSRIVAEAFVPNSNPEVNTIVRHLDDNPLHNHYTNLKWGTHKENTWDAIRNHKIVYDENRVYTRGDLHGGRVLNSEDVTIIIEMLMDVIPLKEIANELNVDIDVIRHIYKGNSWTCLTEEFLPFPKQENHRKPMDPDIKSNVRLYLIRNPNAYPSEIIEHFGLDDTRTMRTFIGKTKRRIRETIMLND